MWDRDDCAMLYVFRTWKKRPKQNGIATVSLNDAVRGSANVDFICWKVHTDWIQELKYYHDMGQVISCSNSTNTALVIGMCPFTFSLHDWFPLRPLPFILLTHRQVID